MGLFDFLSNDEPETDTCPLEENADDGLMEYYGDESVVEEMQQIEEVNGFSPEHCQEQGRSCDECMGDDDE